MSEIEEWRDCVGYEGFYQVSNLGRVRNNRGRILKTTLSRDGYLQAPCFHPDRKRHTIHRLVAVAFLPNPENKPVVDHIDRNRVNNKVQNLRWATVCENARNTERKPGRSGELNIKVRYIVEFRDKEKGNFRKSCKSMEEAIALRNKYLSEV